MERPDLGVTWVFLHHAHELVSSSLARALEAETGLGASECYVLFRLASAPQECLRMGDLAGLLDMAQSGITRLVDRLEERGLVAREQPRDNRRTTLARLTPEGVEAYHRIKPVFMRTMEERLSMLTLEESARLRQLLHKVMGSGDAWERGPWPPQEREVLDGPGCPDDSSDSTS